MDRDPVGRGLRPSAQPNFFTFLEIRSAPERKTSENIHDYYFDFRPKSVKWHARKDKAGAFRQLHANGPSSSP